MSRRCPPLTTVSAACALLAAWPAWAQQEGAPGTDGPRAGTKLERVEITARPSSDTELRRRAPVAKQVYGREELDKYGDTNVSDVLKRLPGVNMAGGAPRMRGLGSGYTLILLNGDPVPPGFSFDQLDPAQVERIEVTKGPSAEHSAQAVAGTINIILKEAPKVSSREVRIGLGGSIKPVITGNVTLNQKQGGFSYSLPVSLFQWRNRQEGQSERRTAGQDGLPALGVQATQMPMWGHGLNFGPRFNWKVDDDRSLALNLFLAEGRWHNDQLFTTLATQGQPRLDDSTTNHGMWNMARFNAQWNQRLSDTQRLELKLGGQGGRSTYDNLTLAPTAPQRQSVGVINNHNLTQSGKFSQLIGEAHSLQVGWDLESRQMRSAREVRYAGVVQLPAYTSEFTAHVDRIAVYAQDEWEITPQWSAALGLRGERIATRGEGLAGQTLRSASHVWTPLLHTTYKLDPKGRDLIRASLTRSYKAPDANALLARPSISMLFPDLGRPNTLLSPDSSGNPQLKPELATGIDLSFEKYFEGGGMASIGVFHRRITDLMRSQTTLQTVPWASVPRWVTQPINLASAASNGLEMEIKGRAGELMPALFDPRLALNLRASVNIYTSRVADIPGRDNRLDSQQPWSANLGADYRFSSVPLLIGGSLAYTPGYATQQTPVQWQSQGRVRSLDAFAMWSFSRDTALRVSAGNIAPLANVTETVLSNGDWSRNRSTGRTWYGVMLSTKF